MPGASPRAACREAAGGHAFRDEAERLLRGQLCGQRAQEPEQLAQLHRQRLRAPGARAGQGQPARRQEVQCDQLRRLRPGARREASQGEEEEAEEEARYLQQCRALCHRAGTTLCSPGGCFLPSERAPAWSLQGMGGGVGVRGWRASARLPQRVSLCSGLCLMRTHLLPPLQGLNTTLPNRSGAYIF